MKKTLISTLLVMNLFYTQNTLANSIQEPIIPAIAGLQSKAILLGFAKNQYDLGMAYYEGKVIPKNTTKAVEWLNRASQKNYAPAKVALAQILLTGDGVNQNISLALSLLQQAARKGDAQALQLLSQIKSIETNSNSKNNIDQILLCSDWKFKESGTPAFHQHLATRVDMEEMDKNFKAAFNKQYIEQDAYQYYPELKDAVGDAPEVRIFLAKNPESSLFSRIQTEDHYGYGTRYVGFLRPKTDINTIKNHLEQRDGFKFSSYNQSQLLEFFKHHNADNSDLSEKEIADLRLTFEKKFFGLQPYLLIENEKSKHIYSIIAPRADKGDISYFAEYLYLIEMNNGAVEIRCGTTEFFN